MDKIEITEEQKTLIRNRMKEGNNFSIAELVALAFPNVEEKYLDGRSAYGKAIKYFIVQDGGKPPESEKVIRMTKIVLTKEQEEYIRHNCQNMGAYELASFVFHNPSLSPASREVRAVVEFLRTLPSSMVMGGTDDLPDGEYKAPKKLDQVIARINKYVSYANLDFRNLTPKHKKQCESLINYLHNFRFKHQINKYLKTSQKELFESAFIEYTWDKDDLTSEDVDQYIILATEKVISSDIQETIHLLQSEQDRQMNENNGRLNMSIVDAIKTAREEYNSCIKRQQLLYNILTQDRSKRLSERVKEHASLLNLIRAWKLETPRLEIIAAAEKRNESTSKELDELDELDQLKYRLLGMSKDQILHG